MEEDIKILEDFIKYCEAKVISKKNNRAFGICIYEDDIQALENLLKGYRKLEEELKREKIWRIRLEKENEDTCNEVNNNYIRKSLVIPKSKIKEKIEELEEERKKKDEENTIDVFYDQIDITHIIEVLQELLGDE